MQTTKRKWDLLLSKDKREKFIREITTYFATERDEEIGVLAAEEILDFFLESIGKDIYNKAINDSKTTIKQSMENLEIDLDLLLNK